MKYPYYIVISYSGRLPTPIQYQHTPIDKLFKTGKIGGTKSEEHTTFDAKDAQQRGFIAERSGKRVEICKVERPNTPRRMCRLWKNPNWDGEI